MEKNWCPAQMILTKRESNGQCELVYYNHHMNHDCTTVHVNLDSSTKVNVAKMLKQNVDKQHIIRNSKSKFGCYLTRSDLRNICLKFNINLESKFHSNDVISVDQLVEDFRQQGHHVLCYKKVGDERKGGDQSDFIFGKSIFFSLLIN